MDVAERRAGIRDAINSGNKVGNHGPSAKTNIRSRKCRRGPGRANVLQTVAGAIAERRMSHQYVTARLSKGLGNHFGWRGIPARHRPWDRGGRTTMSFRSNCG